MFDGLPNLRLPEALASGTRRRYDNDRTTQRLHQRSFISLQPREAASPPSNSGRPNSTSDGRGGLWARSAAATGLRGLIHEYYRAVA
jgi:hypothetical protein